MRNIEEDIKVLKNIQKLRRIEFKHCVTDREERALENILAEREQYKKRIQELENESKKYTVKLTDEQYRNLVDTIRKEIKQEFKQKIKNILQNNRNELFGMTYLSKEQYKTYEMQVERINKIEQELLEGEK